MASIHRHRASLVQHLVLLLACSACVSSVAGKALLAPVFYDPSTSLFSLTLGTGPPLLLDLDSSNLWLDCVRPAFSSPPLTPPALQPVRCHSALCRAAGVCNSLVCGPTSGCSSCAAPPSPVCANGSCIPTISNTATSSITPALLWTSTFSILSTDGQNPGPVVVLPDFAFACGTDLLLRDHAVPAGVVGDAGLSRSAIALPTQLAQKLGLQKIFTYCLPSTGNGKGIAIFGQSPIVFMPGINFTDSFRYTPLLRDSKQPDSYFLGVKTIAVNGVNLSIDPALLKIRGDDGGVIISTTARYTQLQSSIYDALAMEFKSAANARGIQSVAAIKPFDTCFNASTALSTRVGYNVPTIDLFLQGSGGPTWSIFGANSVVSLDDFKVICLAFERTGELQTRSIVLGTYQQQDALVRYDLQNDRLGFISTLLGAMATCSNFNFTSVA